MLRSLFILLLACLLLASSGCSGSGDSDSTGEPVEFPDFLADEFDTLDSRYWSVQLDPGTASPAVVDGTLRFQWSDADLGSRVRLALKEEGYYEAVALDVPVLDVGVEARITLELEAGGLGRRAHVGLRGATQRFAEAVVSDSTGDEIQRETATLSNLDLPPGVSDQRIRLEVDGDEEVIRFFFADELLLEYSEPGLAISPSSSPTIEVEARDTADTAISRFEAARLEEVLELRLADVIAAHTPPSRVQWLYKLRDATGAAVVPSELVDLDAEIFENEAPVDEAEGPPAIRTVDALQLQVALVLDHTRSMEEFGGIAPMKEGGVALLDSLAESHQFSVWEFHDNQNLGVGFSQLLPSGVDHELGKEVVSSFDPDVRGFTRCWDAVLAALMEDFEGSDSSALRVVVLLSDGVDTSSNADPDDLVDEAQDLGVLLYCIGYGQLSTDSRATLLQLSNETSGLFLEAPDVTQLQPAFQRLIDELSGYLQLSYVTGRALDTSIDVLAAMKDQGLAVQQVHRETVNGRNISFDDENDQYLTQAGVLRLGLPLVETEGDDVESLEVSLRADHIPRLLEGLQVTTRLYQVVEEGDDIEIPLSTTPGGAAPLLQLDPDPAGPLVDWEGVFIDQTFVFQDQPELSFGDFGPLLRIRVSGIDLAGALRLELAVDNSLYGGVLGFAGEPSTSIPLDDWLESVTTGQ